MMTPIQDPSDASAVVPILVRGPAELGDKIRLIQFERTFDPSLVQRADRVLERILQGLDLPKDMVSGMANVRYSNALQIEESLFKAHVEPLTLLICDALTDTYLRPALIAAGYTREQAERIRFWYDPSEVVSRPNRNADALQAYDRYSLSSRALREATGFSEDDAPTIQEVVLRLLQQKGPITPELAEALLSQVRTGLHGGTRAPTPPRTPRTRSPRRSPTSSTPARHPPPPPPNRGRRHPRDHTETDRAEIARARADADSVLTRPAPEGLRPARRNPLHHPANDDIPGLPPTPRNRR